MYQQSRFLQYSTIVVLSLIFMLYSHMLLANTQDVFFSDVDSSVAIKIISQADDKIAESKQKSRLLVTEKRLLELIEAIHNQNQQLSDIYLKIEQKNNEQDSENLNNQLRNSKSLYLDLRKSFNEIAAGGVSLQKIYDEKGNGRFEIDSGINEILQPFVISLKRMTETPRKVELYKAELSIFKQRLDHINNALFALSGIIELTSNDELKASLLTLEKKWLLEKTNAQHHIEATREQFNDIIERDKFELSSISSATISFLGGTGLNFLLAILTFTVTLSLLAIIRWAWMKRPGSRSASAQFYSRALHLLFKVLSVLLALAITIIMLYARRDWLLLGLLGLIIVGITWSLKNTLPRVINEVRLIMNMGVVRERERVHYKGIPWVVESIGLFTQLSNPALTAGQIRIRLDELNLMHARENVSNEPWFPTREGDFVLLNDSEYGQVELQTPEMVYLRTIGSAIRNYPTADFVRMSPINLSKHGFSLFFTLKLDKSHISQITSTIIDNLQASMISIMKSQAIGTHLKSITIDFKQSTLESLELICIAAFDGEAACSYYPAQGALHRAAIDTCNEFNWVLAHKSLEVTASIND